MQLFSPEDGSELFLGDDGYYHSETSDSVFEIFDGKPYKVNREIMYNPESGIKETIENNFTKSDTDEIVHNFNINSNDSIDIIDDNSLKSESDDLQQDEEDLYSRFFNQWKKFISKGLESKIEAIDLDSESTKKDIMHFAQLESKRAENNNSEEAKEYFKEYLRKINDIFNSDNSSDVYICSSFRIDDSRCTHVIEKVADNFSSILMCGSFNYDEEFRKGLLIPAIVGYSRRNQLSFVEISPNPRNTSVFVVHSHATNGNSLSIENIDERYAREIKYNIEKIPAGQYEVKSSGEKLNQVAGYVGIIELCLLTFIVTLVVGIVLAIEIMK